METLDFAAFIANKIPVKKGQYRLCAIITDRKDNVISYGFNSYIKTHPYQARMAKKAGRGELEYLHAEIQAILRARGKGDRIYVARVSREGLPRLAKPCSVCQLALDTVGIEEIYYTQ